MPFVKPEGIFFEKMFKNAELHSCFNYYKTEFE